MESTNRWYVIHTYSGYENRVTANLERKIHSLGMENEIFRILVPMENEVEITKDGKKKVRKKKKYPGYVLVEMIMTDEAWYVVRNTPGVTGFLGSSGKGAKPFPLFPHEIEKILNSMGMSTKEVIVDLKVGDRVKITDGPFKLMVGKVFEIDKENSKAKVNIDLFGQETAVEVDLTQIEHDN